VAVRVYALVPSDFTPLHRLPSEYVTNDVADADVILVGTRYAARVFDLLRDAKRVRWIHALAAGVDKLPFDLLRPMDVVVTNSRGLYADALAEFVIASMLFFAKDLRRLVRNHDARRWEPFDITRLEGQTAGVIGYGGIGQAVARRAQGLGMHLIATRRQRELGDPTIDDAIGESDYVVLSAPLTPSTYHLMNAERIAAMKPGAVLINVSRGPIVDEAALIEALQQNRIRGAALDVFEVEPLPPDHPLWSLDNVLISPHSADHTADSHDRAMTFFLENLARFERGDALENVVDKNEQY
jgi:phosphoglycerate dehydrogenase-like enzyme